MGLARFLDQGYGLDATLATSLELAQGQMDSRSRRTSSIRPPARRTASGGRAACACIASRRSR